MVSNRPLIFKSSSLCLSPLRTVSSAPITICITITFTFHSLFSFLARSRYLSLFSLSISFSLWSAGTAYFPIQQVLLFLLTITWYYYYNYYIVAAACGCFCHTVLIVFRTGIVYVTASLFSTSAFIVFVLILAKISSGCFHFYIGFQILIFSSNFEDVNHNKYNNNGSTIYSTAYWVLL